MKNILLIFFTTSFFFSCQKTSTTAILSGKIEGSESEFLILYKADDRYSYRSWLSAVDTTSIAADGEFRFEFPIAKADYYQICDDKGFTQTMDLYLAPGDSLRVTRRLVDNRNVFDYAGSRAGAFSYYSRRDSLRNTNPLFKGNNRDLYYVSTDSLKNVLSKRLQWEKDLIHEHFDENPDWQPIAEVVQNLRSYESYNEYFRYLYYHNYYVNDTFVYLFPDTSFYDFMKDVDLTSAPDDYMWEYQAFLSSYVQDRVEHVHKDLADSVKWQNSLELKFGIIKEHLQGEPRDAALFALTDEFSHAMANENFYDVLATIEEYFQENHTAEHYFKKFLHVAQEFKSLKPGSPAPDIALPDINGDTVRFSDLKGKVVYVDFWGTWCYPCLQELPHSLTLQEKLKNENVEFVYIALEGGEEQVTEWKEFVTGKRSFSYAPFLEQRIYPGVQLLSIGQFNNPELKPYKINSAPTYMLIDAAGNIAQARAPRPSDPDIETTIREVINRK